MVNSVYFEKEQTQEMLDFINNLNQQSYGKGKYKFEILVRPADCGAFTVEFIQVPWDSSFGGHFEYVEEDQAIMVEKRFPDGHYEYCFDEEDYKERLDTWLEENPGWVLTGYGTWTNEIENEKFRKEFEDTKVEPADLHYENGIPQSGE